MTSNTAKVMHEGRRASISIETCKRLQTCGVRQQSVHLNAWTVRSRLSKRGRAGGSWYTMCILQACWEPQSLLCPWNA